MVAASKHVGRYELLSELGRGGMAELYLGRLRGVGGFSKLVAIKRMLPALAQDKNFVGLFLNEGRIAARMAHPNLCQVFELGEADGELYLVMEYLEGVTWEVLSRSLPDDSDLILRATAGVIAQACEGMHYAHELKTADGVPAMVVHRDISPQNLFVTVDGTCKILDFGVAKMATEVSNTKTGVVKGKLPYMSPEQIRGEKLDGRSDVWALGVVLWEGLARKPLFIRDTEFLTWKAILDNPIDTLTSAAPHYSDAVDSVVMRALERDVDKRYASARELGQDLRALAAISGGAYSQVELGELLRKHCSDQLEARARQISGMTTRASMSDSSPTIVERPARSPTTNVSVRDHSTVGSTRPKRRALLATALLGTGVAVAMIVKSQLGDGTTEATQPAVSPPATPAIAASPDSPSPREPAPRTAPPIVEPKPTPLPTPPKSAVAPTRTKTGNPRSESPKADLEVTKPPASSSKPGTLSLDVKPAARVYIDGAFVDETPLFQHSLTAGSHELRLVRPDGSMKVVNIKIEPGKALNLKTVTW